MKILAASRLALIACIVSALLTMPLNAQPKSAIQFYDTTTTNPTTKIGWTGTATNGNFFVEMPNNKKITVTNGDMNINGQVTATQFNGNGSGLTNVTPNQHSHTEAEVTGLTNDLGKKADTTWVNTKVGAKADTTKVNQLFSGAQNNQVWKKTAAGYGWANDSIGTSGTGVTQLTASNGISLNPTSGIGNVGLSLNYSGTGSSNTVARADHLHRNLPVGLKIGTSAANTLYELMIDSIINGPNVDIHLACPNYGSADFGTGPGGHYIFGYGDYPLYFGTNGVERMRIAADGGTCTITVDSMFIRNPTYANYIKLETSAIKLYGYPLIVPEPSEGLTNDPGLMFGKPGNYAGKFDRNLTTYHFSARVNDWGGTALVYVSDNLRFASTYNTDSSIISTSIGSINFKPQSGIVKIAGATVLTSDSALKKNIIELDSALSKIDKLKCVYFDFKSDEYPSYNLPKNRQIGVIAQDVEKSFPELVYTDKDGFKSVDYDKIGAILIGAVKEQQRTIDSQKREIEELKRQVSQISQYLNSK